MDITLFDPTALGAVTFSARDQERFANLSGDFNPMHMDPLAARRTQAGALVVHGIHSLLRGIELLAAQGSVLPPVAELKASFTKLIYVGDTVQYRLSQISDQGVVIEATVDNVEVSRVKLTFGLERSPASPFLSDNTAVQRPVVPQDLTMQQMVGLTGLVGAPVTAAEIGIAFPAATRIWSESRLLAIICTTTLVGMVCPGLHSIYSTLSLHACPLAQADQDALCYRVTRVDPRFRLTRMQVGGAGVWGSIDSFVRVPSVEQAAIGDVAGLVARDEFHGGTALVIGGSRGLGELTAKLLAAGGADVIITYATGQRDAEACADAIRGWGGKCEIMHYDVRQQAAPQLMALAAPPTHLYYFATPPIARRKSALFVAARYEELQAFYVTGFYDLFQTLHADSTGLLTAFYPSTIYVESHSAELAEYAMAKLAGEGLAAAINAHIPNARVVINRLPALPTDQNATIVQAETADPIATMLPIIRTVQASM